MLVFKPTTSSDSGISLRTETRTRGYADLVKKQTQGLNIYDDICLMAWLNDRIAHFAIV